MDDYKITIGIECHVQLATKTKLFSPADNDARGAEPNQQTHPIDFGLPGMLPVLNKEAITLSIRAGKALNARIASESRFDRKHYFYPDLPKGYQTTQFYEPIIQAGQIDVPQEDGSSRAVKVHHAHLEEDAGKLTHYGDYSLVDLNRAGTPLLEIVSEPDMHSPAEAKAYAAELHKLMTYAGVTNGDLYHGNMRFDVNLSLAKKGASELGTRAEVKNLNSFRSVEKAAEYEAKRQFEVLSSGEAVVQETRGWDDTTMRTSSQRSKEDAQDYRYMPDADIPPITLSVERITEVQATVGVLPPEYRALWQPLGLDKSVVNSLLANQQYAKLVTAILQTADGAAAKRVAHWLSSSMSEAEATEASDEQPVVRLQDLIELNNMTAKAELSSTNAKELFSELMNGATDVRELAGQRNMLQESDEDAIGEIVDAVLADPASEQAVADIKAGNDKAIGFLVGQVMKQSKGKANPGMAQLAIRKRVDS